MSNKTLWIGVGFLVATLLVGGYFVFSIQKPQKTATPTAETQSKVPVETPSPEVISGEVKAVTIVGDEYSFSPKNINLTKGEKVLLTFKNAGRLPHNLVIDGLGVAIKTISGGESTTINFVAEESGTFESYCSIGNHKALGMEGNVKVE